ncbi:hypothetical protein P9139_08120 [Curtobacterium flaccumfaciens]|nr:hypothetical protein P9139_08120 [Curtobacterium flaccumfaciens]
MRVVVSALSGLTAGIVTWGDRPFDDFLRKTLSPLASDQAAAVLAEASALLRLRLGPLR